MSDNSEGWSSDYFWSQLTRTVEISSLSEALDLIHGVFKKWSEQGSIFVWRGQVNADWGLHSSLYRRLAWTNGGTLYPTEEELQNEEHAICVAVHKWGLHTGSSGRLSLLRQLAILQHYGAPTRLIDITFNPLIGLWFAVEEQWDNGKTKNEDKDGRLFAIDVSARQLNEQDDYRHWEDTPSRPWPRPNGGRMRSWTTEAWAWKPSRLDHRISAQNGGFLLGGVPSKSFQIWRTATAFWDVNEVRGAMSVPLRFNKLDPQAGREPNNPAYTVKIKSEAKPDIRKHLEKLYGYTHSTLFPDYPGFALHGWTRLLSHPVVGSASTGQNVPVPGASTNSFVAETTPQVSPVADEPTALA